MFCPKCGDELVVDARGSLACERGGMQLSPHLAARLTDSFILKKRPSYEPKGADPKFRWGGTWFCPACGVRAKEEGGAVVRCPDCGRNLGEFLHELIELHPHSRAEA